MEGIRSIEASTGALGYRTVQERPGIVKSGPRCATRVTTRSTAGSSIIPAKSGNAVFTS